MMRMRAARGISKWEEAYLGIFRILERMARIGPAWVTIMMDSP